MLLKTAHLLKTGDPKIFKGAFSNKGANNFSARLAWLLHHLTSLKLPAGRILWSGHPSVASDLLCYLQSSFTSAAFDSKVMSIPDMLFSNILEGVLPVFWSYKALGYHISRVFCTCKYLAPKAIVDWTDKMDLRVG